MQGILFGAIVGIASVFLALTIAIIAGKAWREIRDRRHRARRKVLEPIVLAYAHGSEASILPALGGGVAPSDRPVLEKILLDHAQRVSGIERARLAKVLDELGFVDVYRRGLHAAGWWTRAESAENLGLSGAVRVAPDLLAALEDDASEVRLRAARALGAIGADAAVAPLLRALSEPNRWSTIRIADILAGMGPRIVGELVAAYPTLNRPGRLATLDIVGRLRPLETAGWLVERTRDPESDVRARACAALGEIGSPDSRPALRSALTDPAWPVRAMAAKSIGKVGDSSAIPDLCAALRDREWWVRANAAYALKSAGGPGLDALERMLDDADLYARHQACLMLQESGRLDERVDDLALPGPNRDAAIGVVRRFVDAGQVGRLRQLGAGHPWPDVRSQLETLLPQPAARAAETA